MAASSTKLVKPAHVLVREADDELVLLDLSTGAYFGLNALGSRVWHFLLQGMDPAEVCEHLLCEFDAGAQQVQQDVGELIGQLLSRGLLTSEPDSATVHG
jgi:hypothetical protein